jgi:hypothetical protein
MKQLFKIDESEKRRIIEMHENATKRNYLSEQGQAPAPAATTQTASQREPFTSASGVKYKLPIITSDEDVSKFITINNGTIDSSFLASLGIKGLPAASTDPGQPNFTTTVYRLLRSYVDAAAQLVGQNKMLCDGFKNIAALDRVATKNEDYSTLFQNLGGGKIDLGKTIFYNAVTKVLQTQINKLNGCQS